MQLYLIRHGVADDGKPGQADSERALTPEGKKKLRGILKAAREAGVAPTLVMTSPYRRAFETAELAAAELGYKGELVRTDTLIPAGKPEAAWDEVRVHQEEAQILLAGHDPLFTHLTGHLLGCPGLVIDFKKGAMVRIDLDRFGPAPRGVLKWMLVPKLAR